MALQKKSQSFTPKAHQVDAIIVAYNRKAMIFELLPHLLDTSLIHQVIVVDNASTDGIDQEGPGLFPQVHWLRLTENIGCAAWNIGMRDSQAEFGIVLDDDCVPDRTALSEALTRMEREPKIGLCAFNILNAYTGQSEWEQMEDADSSGGWASAIGACMIVRVQAFLKVGGYKDYFLCFNDLDLALTMWENGYQVVYNKDWRAYHKQKIIQRKPRRFYFELRNFMCTLFDHFPAWISLLIAAKFLLGALIDARTLADYAAIGKGLVTGLKRGAVRQKETRKALPAPVKELFYQNYLYGKRFPRLLRKIHL